MRSTLHPNRTAKGASSRRFFNGTPNAGRGRLFQLADGKVLQLMRAEKRWMADGDDTHLPTTGRWYLKKPGEQKSVLYCLYSLKLT